MRPMPQRCLKPEIQVPPGAASRLSAAEGFRVMGRAAISMFEVVVIAAVGLVLSGCSTTGGSSGEDGTSLPNSRPGITEVDPGSGEETAVARILVEENPRQGKPERGSGGPKGGGILHLEITGETRVVREDGETLARATSADLAKGRTVSVWHTEVIMRSYPGQAAERVISIKVAKP